MIREGYIFDKICDIDNIKNAIMNASCEKRDEPCVRRILSDIDYYAETLRNLLLTKHFKPSEYILEEIADGLSGKQRTLYKPRFFPDQCVHWALMLQVEHLFMRGMYKYNCGSIKGRGTLYAKEYTEAAIRCDYRNTKYCLKGDIYHFYQSCKHSVIKKKTSKT